VGRLENIIARNQRKGRSREKILTQLALGVIFLVLLVLAVCTDLGRPPQPAAPGPPPVMSGSGGSAAAARPAERIDGVLLRGRAKPAARPTASP
jgi:hypothetical protein